MHEPQKTANPYAPPPVAVATPAPIACSVEPREWCGIVVYVGVIWVLLSLM